MIERADRETAVGDEDRRGARVTEGRLREASASMCRNEAMLFHFPLKALCQWAETDQAHQPDRQIIRKKY